MGRGALLALGAVALLALAGGAKKGGSKAPVFDPSKGHDEPGDPDVPGGTDPATGETKKESQTPRAKRVPQMTQDPEGYNTQMFPNAAAVQGTLAGLGYPQALQGSNAFRNAVRAFQRHWNIVSQAGMMPESLAGTELPVDGIAGAQTLRALEWANIFDEIGGVGMAWISVVQQAT